MSFNFSNVGDFFGVEFSRTVAKFRKKIKNCCLVITSSRKRETRYRTFHVVVAQLWERNVPKKT